MTTDTFDPAKDFVVKSVTDIVAKTPDRTVIDAKVTVESRSRPLDITLSATSTDIHILELYNEVITGKWGNIAPYSPPVVAFDPTRVKFECQRRIEAVASQAQQINLQAAVTVAGPESADAGHFETFVLWIKSMRSTSASMIASSDPGFADDAKWPALNSDALAWVQSV